MTAAEKLLAEVLALPKSERAKLVARAQENLAEDAETSRPDLVAEGRGFVERNRDLLERLAK